MKFKNISLARDLLLVSIPLVSLGKVGLKIMENDIGNLSQHFVGGIVKEHFSTE